MKTPKIIGRRKTLKIFYENMDGISEHKFSDILQSSSSTDYDMLAFSETWLKDDIYDYEFMDTRYTVFRKDRTPLLLTKKRSTIGGGVLIAVKNGIQGIQCEEYKNQMMKQIEAICVRITGESGNIYVYCLYIQPAAPAEIYQAHVESIKLLTSSTSEKDTIVILGDFNFSDTIAWRENDEYLDYIPIIGESESEKSKRAREVTNSMIMQGLFQMTNYQNVSGNVLDLVYTNIPEIVVVNKADYNILPQEKSDDAHVPLMCTIDWAPNIVNNADSQSVYCFNKANYGLIKEHLRSGLHQVDSRNDSKTLNEMVSDIYTVIYDSFQKYVPSTTIRSNTKPKWHNKQLAKLKNKRNKEHNKLNDM